MADAETENLYRLWQATGSVGDEADYLRARLRVGEISDDQLACSALCGGQASQLALSITYPPLDKDGIEEALSRWGINLGNIFAHSLLTGVKQRLPETGLEQLLDQLILLFASVITEEQFLRSVQSVLYFASEVERQNEEFHYLDRLHQVLFYSCRLIQHQTHIHDHTTRELAEDLHNLMLEARSLGVQARSRMSKAVSSWKLYGWKP